MVTTCSPRLMRAAQRARLCAITCTASPDPYQVDADARAPTSVAEAHRFADVVRTGPRSMNFSIPIWITASDWREDSNSILVRADFGRLLEKHGTGVYTLVLWGRTDGESVVVAESQSSMESRRRIFTVVATHDLAGRLVLQVCHTKRRVNADELARIT